MCECRKGHREEVGELAIAYPITKRDFDIIYKLCDMNSVVPKRFRHPCSYDYSGRTFCINRDGTKHDIHVRKRVPFDISCRIYEPDHWAFAYGGFRCLKYLLLSNVSIYSCRCDGGKGYIMINDAPECNFCVYMPVDNKIFMFSKLNDTGYRLGDLRLSFHILNIQKGRSREWFIQRTQTVTRLINGGYVPPVKYARYKCKSHAKKFWRDLSLKQLVAFNLVHKLNTPCSWELKFNTYHHLGKFIEALCVISYYGTNCDDASPLLEAYLLLPNELLVMLFTAIGSIEV